MKKITLGAVLLLMFVGCAYEGQGLSSYFNPKTLVKDPHFAEYKAERDELESQYLNKEITYAEYIKQMTELEETYSKEVQERNAKIAY